MLHLRTLTRAVRVASPALSAAAARPSLLASRCCPALLRLSASRSLSTQPPSDSSSSVPPPTAASRPRKIPRAASASSAASGPAAAAGAAASGASDAAADPSLTRSVPRVTETTDQEAGLDTPVPKGKEWKPSQATPELPMDKEALAEAPAQGQAQAQAAAGAATPAQAQPAAEAATAKEWKPSQSAPELPLAAEALAEAPAQARPATEAATPAAPETQSASAGGGGAGSEGGARAQEDAEDAEDKKSPLGPLSWRSVIALMVVGGTAVIVYRYQQDKVQNTIRVESIGTPLLGLGGEFALKDDQGKIVTSESLKGKYVLLYFGFTFCPDICPVELKKMEQALQMYATQMPAHPIVPVFISLDPRRDTPARLAEYKKGYIPNMLWLTGSDAEIAAVAKAYRVYYSASETLEGQDDDYLVDHSIFFYLLDRDGHFMEVFGKSMSAEQVADKMAHIVAAENRK